MAAHQPHLSPSASGSARTQRPETDGDFESISLDDNKLAVSQSPQTRKLSSGSNAHQQAATTPSPSPSRSVYPVSPLNPSSPFVRGAKPPAAASEGRNLLAAAASPTAVSPNLPSSEFSPRKSLPPTPRSASFANVGRYSVYGQVSPNGSLTNLHAPPSPSLPAVSTPVANLRKSSMSNLAASPRPPTRTSSSAGGLNVRSTSMSYNRPGGLYSAAHLSSPSLALPGEHSSSRRASADDGLALPLRRPQDSRHLSRTSLKSPSASSTDIPRDDDSDRSGDDIVVPDDVIFWNVPLTPEVKAAAQPAVSRTPTPGSIPSPDRKSSRASPTRLGLGPDSTPSRLRQHDSWSDAMDHLSDEAKDLTVALEDYRDELKKSTRQQMMEKINLQKGLPVPAARPSPAELKHKSEKETRALSLEDLASTSVTRPSHLPRKSKTEEEKHLREYQKMMLKSQKQEKKKKEKKLSEFAEYQKQLAEDVAYWDSTIMTNPQMKISDARTRTMIWRSGIPLKYRERIWSLMIGNQLGISPTRYDDLLKEIHDAAQKKEEDEAAAAELKLILDDVAETYPETKLFQSSGPLREALVDILSASCKNNDKISYTTGMHTVAAGLLLNLPTKVSFVALANVVAYQPLELFYRPDDDSRLSRFYIAFDRAFAINLPSLHHHFNSSLDLKAPSYVPAFIRPLFTLHLPLDFVPRLWDTLFLEMMLDSPKSLPMRRTSSGSSGSGSTATPEMSSFENLLIAIILAILQHSTTALLTDDKECVLRKIGWEATPISFSSGDVDVPDTVSELEFMRYAKSLV
ncbi:rab-GTPase-TBC domain-containing protein [Myxozyma melibiosi]|uniref:Rab-GTPase-TBC domain-containing protein n=1 Tax=Myxozyma melibiosi TaxID=54550 RepID=A0ABR1F6Y6_9ASCO